MGGSGASEAESSAQLPPQITDAAHVPPRPPLPPRPALPSQSDTGQLYADLTRLGLHGMPIFEAPEPKPPAPLWRRISTWVAVYGVILVLIAFWPQPVDSGAGRILKWITHTFPVLTYQRIEFGANVLLFLPFGIGLALLLKNLRYLIMPLAFLASLTIEIGQAIFIPARYPTVSDIIANTSGACIGLVCVVAIEGLRKRGADAE